MWDNSFRDGQAWKENFGWLTTKGVLVLPITKNSKVDESDYKALPTKVVNGKSFVLYNGDWLGIKAMIHTHPGDKYSGLSAGDLNVTQIYNVPMFALGINKLLVGFGSNTNPVYNQIVTDSKNILNGSWSIYNNILPQLPK